MRAHAAIFALLLFLGACVSPESLRPTDASFDGSLETPKGGKALYLHCLPADITGLSCPEGEVDNSVFDRYIVPLYKQASYKPYIIAAMMFLAQVKDPVRALMEMDKSGEERKMF